MLVRGEWEVEAGGQTQPGPWSAALLLPRPGLGVHVDTNVTLEMA